MNFSHKTVIVIVGPTAVGKTAAAIDLAKQLHTEIISADSRQCYKELNIGVARPSEQELKDVPHHFIASHSIHDQVTAGTFEHFALRKLAELFEQHNVVIMTGGTGLYLRAFIEGMDDIPDVPQAIRKEIAAGYEQGGLPWLQKEIEEHDPEYFKTGETKNPQRLMRALEVIKATGQSILRFRKGKKAERDFNIIEIGLELPRQQLHDNINHRVDAMISAGLVDEARSLLPYRELNALQTVGYKEIFEYLDEKISLQKAIDEIRKHTRQYAKRQMTWFKKDKAIQWFDARETGKWKEHLSMLFHV